MKNYSKQSFYINTVDIVDIVDDYGKPNKIFVFELIITGGEEIRLEVYPNSKKYKEIVKAAFDFQEDNTFVLPTLLMGRIIDGTLFYNLDSTLPAVNADYFKPYGYYDYMAYYFYCPLPNWSDEEVKDYLRSSDYPSFIEQTYGTKVHDYIQQTRICNENYTFIKDRIK